MRSSEKNYPSLFESDIDPLVAKGGCTWSLTNWYHSRTKNKARGCPSCDWNLRVFMRISLDYHSIKRLNLSWYMILNLFLKQIIEWFY